MIPTAALSIEDALLLARMQARGQPVWVELYMEAHFEADRASRNVLMDVWDAVCSTSPIILRQITSLLLAYFSRAMVLDHVRFPVANFPMNS